MALLAQYVGMSKTAENLFEQVIQEYPRTNYENQARLKLGQVDSPDAGFRTYNIRLLEIEEPKKEYASAEFIIKKLDDKGEIEETKVYEGDNAIQVGDYFNENRFKLIRLDEDKVSLVYYISKKDRLSTLPSASLPKKIILTYSDSSEKIGDYIIELKNINYKPVAKISLIPKAPSTYSEADFTFAIGIEKRAIKLSPEKTQEMIENLNESIKKFEGIVESLGKVVKTMKAACLTTASVLVVKNFFANLRGGSFARQDVMGAWNAKAREEVGDKSADVTNYLRQKEVSDKIDQDVTELKKVYEEKNERIIKLEKRYEKDGRVDTDKVKADLSFDLHTKYSGGISYGKEGEVIDNYVDTSLTDLRDRKSVV